MPLADHTAAATLRRLREDRGLSVERLAALIAAKAQREGWIKVHGRVTADTLHRIEKTGHCPSERVRLVVALFFDAKPSDIWRAENRIECETGTSPGIGWRRKAAA